jgi:glycosyltransferase involved in cell wall biosynthesis
MRIGIDCRLYSSKFGGIGRYVHELVKHLLEMDPKSTYVLFKNAKEPLFEGKDNVEEIYVGAKHYSLSEQTKFLKKLKGASLDLMHFTHFNAPLLYRGKNVVTIHDLTIHFHPGKKMTSPLHRLAYKGTINRACKRADKIIAVSESTKKDIIKHIGIPEDNIKVIYEAAGEEFQPITDKSVIDSVKHKYGITKPLLLYTGNLRTHKNLVRLIQAVSKLIKDKRYDCQLMLTGDKDSVYMNDILKTAKKCEMEDNLLLPGLVPEEDLVPLINAAHVYTFPSLYEGFGLPPLEAMQCGTVVCTSNTSSIPEVCSDHVFYFDPEDIGSMTEAIYDSCTHEKERERKREAALKHVERFSWKKTAHQTLEIYRSA